MARKKLKTDNIFSALGGARTAVAWLHNDTNMPDWMDDPLHPQRIGYLRQQRAYAAEALAYLETAIALHDRVWEK